MSDCILLFVALGLGAYLKFECGRLVALMDDARARCRAMAATLGGGR